MHDRIVLSAYQFIDITYTDLGDQFTDGGEGPNTIILRLTTAFDEPFVNKSVVAFLSEQDQRDIIDVLQQNLNTKREETS